MLMLLTSSSSDPACFTLPGRCGSYPSSHSTTLFTACTTQFEGTGGWGCPPGLDGVVPPNCPGLTGDMVLGYYEVMDINKVSWCWPVGLVGAAG